VAGASAQAAAKSDTMKSIPRWAMFLLGIYAGAALLTLGFQIYVRLYQCSGYSACAISIAKGAAWSVIWPASWPVYATGFIRHPGFTRQEAIARLKNDIPADRIELVHRKFLCHSAGLHAFGYRFRIVVKQDVAEGEVCWNFSAQKWTWRILPEYRLPR
jgi:hypothetical protein